MLQPIRRRNGFAGKAAEPAQIVPLRTVREYGFLLRGLRLQQTVPQDFGTPMELGLVVPGLHGDEHGHDHARHGGMDAAVVEQEPHNDGRHKVEAQEAWCCWHRTWTWWLNT